MKYLHDEQKGYRLGGPHSWYFLEIVFFSSFMSAVRVQFTHYLQLTILNYVRILYLNLVTIIFNPLHVANEFSCSGNATVTTLWITNLNSGSVL
jgi:hypothetical protein